MTYTNERFEIGQSDRREGAVDEAPVTPGELPVFGGRMVVFMNEIDMQAKSKTPAAKWIPVLVRPQ
jgi:hypothetical protein